MADSVPSHTSAQFVVDFKHYMAIRADVTQELQHWSDVVYDMALQTDGSSYGVLALMTAVSRGFICRIVLPQVHKDAATAEQPTV